MYDIKNFDNCDKIIPIYPKTWRTNLTQYFGYAMKQRKISGHVMEFGVFKGVSINVMAKLYPNEIIWGFDSFEGLPEEWKVTDDDIRPPGFFKIGMPEVQKNVKLVGGFFDKTLPRWVNKNEGDISFLHIDSDLYSSAKFILNSLNERIKKGTVIEFDDFGNWNLKDPYQYWEDGEWKAFNEWLVEYDRDVDVICRSNRQQAAVIVTK